MIPKRKLLYAPKKEKKNANNNKFSIEMEQCSAAVTGQMVSETEGNEQNDIAGL